MSSAARPASSPVLPRRDRLRAQTAQEIKTAARAELVAHGPSGIQLRAVARDVGLTAPALYRYFPSLEDLVEALTVDLYGELCDELEAARDAVPAGDPFGQILELGRAFRRWAMAHPHEFALMFATPPTAFGETPSNACQEASSRFGSLFAAAFLQMWAVAPFEVPDGDALVPGIEAGLLQYWTWLTDTLAPGIPLGAVVRFLEGWVRIYGSVAMETFGHLNWAMPDGEPMFEQIMLSLAESIGHADRYRPPLPQ
jgi:AcrR family transcriptional regulator